MKNLTTLLAVLLLFHFSNAQTPVSGGIYSNTTWSLANSPYLITGNVVVFPGATLDIEPGVEILVKENGFSGTQFYIEARGTINMIGQPGSRISVRADSAINMVGAWKGFVIKNSQGGAINYDYVSISNSINCFDYDAYIPGVIQLHQCDFNYNSYAVVAGTELAAEDCNFTGNENAIYGWSLFTFNNCVFDSNLSAMSIYASSLNIDNCTFKNNALGISLYSSATGGMLVKNTLFENNTIGFDNPNSGTIDSCVFIDNDEAIKNTIYLDVRNSSFNNNVVALQIGFGTTVSYCDINLNGTGVAFGPIGFGQPMPIVENNRICSNTDYNIDNRTDLNIFLPTNCFCTSDSTVIEDKLFDGYDDVTKGLISYAIFDTTCSVVMRVIDKTGQTNSISENENLESISIFPNPATDKLTITGTKGISQYRIFSLQGQTIQEGRMMEGNNTIDLTQISSGTYFLGLYTNNQKSRFLKIVHN